MISRRIGLAAAVAVVVVAAGAVGWIEHEGDDVPATLGAAVATQVAPLVEQRISADWSGDRMGCATRVFGIEPAGAQTAGEVRVAYVWAECATIGTGVDSGSSLPAAVHLGPAPVVDVPRDGSVGEDIERIFPARLRDDAYGDARTDLSAAVTARVAALG